jgi:uncharacterized membrane protein YukC
LFTSENAKDISGNKEIQEIIERIKTSFSELEKKQASLETEPDASEETEASKEEE